MDFEMVSSFDQESENNYWDFKVEKGKFTAIDHSLSDQQRAVIAAFIQKGTVPQMPSLGNQWAELLTGGIMPSALNAQVKSSIIDITGQAKFMPKYSSKEGKLIVEVVKV